MTALGVVSNALLRLQVLTFTGNQRRLKRRYKINQETPILLYGSRVVRSIRAVALKIGRAATFATTSGSTGKAKEILYTRRRVRGLKLAFSEMFARACSAFRIKRTSLYVFSSFEADTSATSLLLHEHKLPNYLATLQAPYRVQYLPALQALVASYGSVAVRLWVLTIANPGVLYSTNPSTLSTFLDELDHEWQRSSRLIKDWCNKPASFASELHKIAQRLASRGCAERVTQIAASDGPLPLSFCAPAVAAYLCWTGGYVKPFLDRVATRLPSPRYTRIPMYSISTEAIETLPYFRGRDAAFLPLAKGVVYEFIEETVADYARNLLNPHQLEPGKLYAMVVSDGYGLQRYQTDDLFLCRRLIHGIPDLAFVRRRSLEYSFTGEKLTAAQLSTVFEQLRATYPSLVGDRFLTCVPSQPAHSLPHYEVLLIGHQRSDLERSHDFLANRCDELLCQMNCEYKSKRASGRLGPVEVVNIEFKDFAERYATNGNWETQFKFLPLYRGNEERPVATV